MEKWTVLQVSPSFPSLPSRETRRKNGGQVIGVNHGIGIGIICFCFFPPPPPPLFVRPIRSFVCLFIFFFLKSRVKLSPEEEEEEEEEGGGREEEEEALVRRFYLSPEEGGEGAGEGVTVRKGP